MAVERINVKDLERNGLPVTPLEETYDYEDFPLIKPVAANFKLKLSDTGVSVTGDYEAHIEEPCDRCAEPFQRELSETFEERFVHEALVDHGSNRELELHEEDFYDTLPADGMLDLKELIYQYLIIEISHDRICGRPDCEIAESAEAEAPSES